MLELSGVSKQFGDVPALGPIDLRLEAGSVTAIIGPSGCGKSTLLRTVNGLVPPDTGTVFLDGERLETERLLERRRRIGYVIQDGGLFPHLTARGNLTLLADWLGRRIDWTERRLAALTELTRFPSEALDRYPAQLSGGQVQRVALMRALMLEPSVLLLDEPMAALDPLIRSGLQEELRAIFAELGCTVVLVTHDLAEAVFLAQRVVLLQQGKVVQDGVAADLFERPANEFVRRFVNAQRGLMPALGEAPA